MLGSDLGWRLQIVPITTAITTACAHATRTFIHPSQAMLSTIQHKVMHLNSFAVSVFAVGPQNTFICVNRQSAFCCQNVQDTRTTLPLGTSEGDADGCYFFLARVDDLEQSPDYDAALNSRDPSIATVLLAQQAK